MTVLAVIVNVPFPTVRLSGRGTIAMNTESAAGCVACAATITGVSRRAPTAIATPSGNGTRLMGGLVSRRISRESREQLAQVVRVGDAPTPTQELVPLGRGWVRV